MQAQAQAQGNEQVSILLRLRLRLLREFIRVNIDEASANASKSAVSKTNQSEGISSDASTAKL